MKFNWVITGGCGFIGTNLIKKILKEDLANKIIVIDNFSVGSPEEFQTEFCNYHLVQDSKLRQDGYEILLIEGDIRDKDKAIEITQGADIIVHLAANTGVQPSITDPSLDMDNNIIGTFNYLEASRLNSVKKFVFASSCAPIGIATPPIHEKLPCSPISPYGASKLAGEAYCSAYHGSYGIETVTLRFSNVYGPYSHKKNSVVAKFIKQAFNQETWLFNGGGEQTRDFIFVEDLVDALIAAATRQGISGIYQVATNEETTIVDMAKTLASILEEHFKLSVNSGIGNCLPGDVQRNYADISKIKKALGWEPKVKLTEGLKTTSYWFSSFAQDKKWV